MPLNEPKALAKAAQRLLEEQGLRERLVRGSQQRAAEFDHLSMARQSFAIYDQVLSRADAKRLWSFAPLFT